MQKIPLETLLKTTQSELNYIVSCIMQVDSQTASDYTGRAGKAITARLIGAGTSSGLLGLVSTFGTASTGTAIGSLSGAAASNATLAWVGSIIGGGVAAGTIATGGVALVVGIGAYKLLGSAARDYDSLNNIDRQVVDTCCLLIKGIKQQLNSNSKATAEDMHRFYQQALLPLYQTLHANQTAIGNSLDWQNRFAFLNRAISSYENKVINVFAIPEKIAF